jgi:putative isomerase
MNPLQEYHDLQRRLGNGWNTWNTRSVLSHVLLPEGFAINLGIKEYADGHYLKESLIGRQGKEDEVILPGAHAYDGSYTELRLSWRGIDLSIQSAHAGEDLVILVTPHQIPYQPGVLAIEGGILWNRPGYVKRNPPTAQDMQQHLLAVLPNKQIPVFAEGTSVEEPYIFSQSPYLALRLDKTVSISTGSFRSLFEIVKIIEQKQKSHTNWLSTLSENIEALTAMQTCLAWDTIYDPSQERVISPVSRIWNNGGYKLFCWDTYFAGMMAAYGSRDLAYANVVEITHERTEEGFVPNFSFTGIKSQDRSQPPVGSLMVMELYRRYQEIWLLDLLFDDLLSWNRWWLNRREKDGLLAWGSHPYKPIVMGHYEYTGVDDTFGAALESGLDNSPMYDDIPFDHQRHIMQLWDVGLNGLYAADCQALVKMATILGRDDEAEELTNRAATWQENLQRLWNEEAGIFLNRRIDTGKFEPHLAPTMFYPLIAKAASPEQADRMLSEHFYNPHEFWGDWIMPSISRNDPAYHDQEYWRGRIWAPMNFLVFLGLKQYDSPLAIKARLDLAQRSFDLLMNEWRITRHVHENYNANTGEGCDVRSSDRYYHWGALLGLIKLN